MNDWDEAKRILLEIVAAADPAGLTGRTHLFKAFYFSHLYYLEDTGLPLSRWPIVHMPRGPGIDKGAELIQELVREKKLSTTDAYEGPYPTTIYRLGPDAPKDQASAKDPRRAEAASKAVEYVRERTAAQLTEETHEHSIAWQSSTNGEEMDIVLDTLTEEQVDEWRKTHGDAAASLSKVFNG